MQLQPQGAERFLKTGSQQTHHSAKRARAAPMDEPPSHRGTSDTRHGSRREHRNEASRTERTARDHLAREKEKEKEREELRLVPPPRKNDKVLVSPRSQKSTTGSRFRNPNHRSEKRRSWNASEHAAMTMQRRERGPKVRKVAPEDVPSITAPERRGQLHELIGGQWEKRYCVLHDGHFRTYKRVEDLQEESDLSMRKALLKEFQQSEPDRQMCFALNGRIFKAEDDYDLVEWVFAVTGSMQYFAIMQKVKDAINSKAIDKRTVLQKMPSLRLAVEEQLVSPRGGRTLRVPSTNHGSAINSSGGSSSSHHDSDKDEKKEKKDSKESKEEHKEKGGSAITPRGVSRRPTTDQHHASSERLTPRGGRREESNVESLAVPAPPAAVARSSSDIPPAAPSSTHLGTRDPATSSEIATPSSTAATSTLPVTPAITTSEPVDGSVSPRSAKKQHKIQKKAMKEARKAEERAKKHAEEKRMEAEKKAKKDEERKQLEEKRKSAALHRQSSAPNLRSSTITHTGEKAHTNSGKFTTLAIGRAAALTVPETERIVVTTTTPSWKPDGKHKQGHVMVLKKALTIPNWRKRYLSYSNGSLSIHKKETLPASISLSMLFCSCKLGAKGRNGRVYVFEVVSPRKTYFIAVNTAIELREWIEMLQSAQADLMTQTLYASMQQLPVEKKEQTLSEKDQAEARKLLKELREHPENSVCADCNGEDPAWVSLNLGVFLCIECGGVHRKLGVHVSQLRSVALDYLKLDQVMALKVMGTNQQLNRTLYEANPSPSFRKPSPDATPEEREAYIKQKYCSKSFYPVVNSL